MTLGILAQRASDKLVRFVILSIRNFAEMRESFKVTIFLLVLSCSVAANINLAWARFNGFGEQPLSKIAIYKATLALRDSASINAYPVLLGLEGEDTQWVTVNLVSPDPSEDDWVGVFSPAKFE